MMVETVVRDVLVTLSAFSVGSALFTAALCLRMFRANRRRYASFAAAKVGYAIVTGTILLRVLLPNPALPPDGWAIAYAVGLTSAGLGFVGVGRTIRREFVAWEVAQDPRHPDFNPEEERV
jgi:hypothetical protein